MKQSTKRRRVSINSILFLLSGAIAFIAGAVGSAGLYLYLNGIINTEVLTVDPYAVETMTAQMISSLCGLIGASALVLGLFSSKRITLVSSLVLTLLSLVGAFGFFVLGYSLVASGAVASGLLALFSALSLKE